MSGNPSDPTDNRYGRFSLKGRIAVGGMAEVYLADDDRGGPCVVKRMLPEIGAMKGSREMFAEEARIGMLVDHPNVVSVLEIGERDGAPWLALEYVPGVDLRRFAAWLRRESGQLEPQLAVFIVRELLAGLIAVHTARDEEGVALAVVHRDVSPSNTLLSVDGRVLLGDFGIAHAMMAGSFPSAHKGARGKLGYVAPEQLRGAAVDQRADVFAAAVIAAELFLGRPLFVGGSELAILLAIRDGDIRPFREHVAKLPEGLGKAIIDALATDPSERTRSASALRDALAPYTRTRADVLAAELGQLVAIARGADEEQERPELATRELGAAQVDIATPRVAPEDLEATPSVTYVIEAARGGERFGPWSLAETIEAVATGKVAADDLVETPGGPRRPIYSVPELRVRLPLSSSVTGVTADIAQPSAPDRSLTLEQGGIVTALARTAMGRESGLWLCAHEGVRKEIYVLDGAPEFVTSNQSSELLGEYLVRREIITRGELDMALAVMPRFEARLGDTLASLGLVEPMQLLRHIAEQVMDKLLALFEWDAGTATFYRGIAPPEGGFALGLDAWIVIDRGLDRRFEVGAEQATFEVHMLDLVRSLHPAKGDVIPGRLPAAARRLLRLLERGPLPLTEIVDALDDPSGRDPRRAYRAVRLLLALDVLEWC